MPEWSEIISNDIFSLFNISLELSYKYLLLMLQDSQKSWGWYIFTIHSLHYIFSLFTVLLYIFNYFTVLVRYIFSIHSNGDNIQYIFSLFTVLLYIFSIHSLIIYIFTVLWGYSHWIFTVLLIYFLYSQFYYIFELFTGFIIYLPIHSFMDIFSHSQFYYIIIYYITVLWYIFSIQTVLLIYAFTIHSFMMDIFTIHRIYYKYI